MRRAFLVMVAACGPAAVTPVVKNEHRATSTPPPAALGCPAGTPAKVPPGSSIFGVVCDQDGTPLEGATIVATSTTGHDTPAVIADEHGLFFFANLAGTYKLTFYYTDCSRAYPTEVIAGETAPVIERMRLNGAGNCIP